MRVEGQLVFNNIVLTLNAVLAGLGLAYLPEDMVKTHLAKRRLVRVLADWCPPFSGYHLYYPSRRQHTSFHFVGRRTSLSMMSASTKRTAYHFRGVDRSERRMCSHLKDVSAKPITGISAKTTGITKNAILLRSEVSQKEVYRCHKVGPER